MMTAFVALGAALNVVGIVIVFRALCRPERY